MLLLALPACGIPNLRLAMPGPVLPAAHKAGFQEATGPESSAKIPIEAFFNDPKLVSLICQALSGGNLELRILNEDIQIAQNEVLGRSGAYLPFVDLGLVAGLEKFSRFEPLGAAERELTYLPGKHFPEPEGNFLAASYVSWQVDIWRQLRNLRDSAKLRALATAEGRNYTVTRLVAEIAGNYYMLMALDKRIENLDSIITLQQESLRTARARMERGRSAQGSVPVLRFGAEVRLNESQKQITRQTIVEVENRINFLVGRYPQPVDRSTGRFIDFIDLSLPPLSLGVPALLLQNRPDIRQAERQVAAAGLDVKAARARFFPRLDITGPDGPTGPAGPIGWHAFNPKYLFWTPDALLVNIAGNLVTPLINKRGIRADYKTANARQLQAVYNYQRVILNAYTEVVTRMSRVQLYGNSIAIKKQQVQGLEDAVAAAMKLYKGAFAPAMDPTRRVDYMDVLFAQRDLWEARLLLIETKQEQLTATVDVYQALGGGLLGCGCGDPGLPGPGPTLAQSQQGGSDQPGTDDLPAPRQLSDQLPAPGKQPEQPSGPGLDPSQQGGSDPSGTDELSTPRQQSEQPPGPAQPDRVPEPRKLPADLPSPGPALE